jgi:hypothetical protein
MNKSFVVMQIGNDDLDNIYNTIIDPAIRACNLSPIRVDKHNEGRLLKSEIVKFIQEADIIIADLTNERPNCYLEIGYAMGLDKYRNIILTAREDHHPDSPNHVKNGPKIHFDLSGYDILFWDPSKLDLFKNELENRIRRRLLSIRPITSDVKSYLDEKWIENNRKIAQENFKVLNKTGFMELFFCLINSSINVSQTTLFTAAETSQIETFGWPIGLVNRNPEFKPKPKTDGIFAEIIYNKSYDYWYLTKNGTFYLFRSIFEDEREENVIFYNTRIVQVTEALLYVSRLYTSLNINSDDKILIKIKHGGLKERVMSGSGQHIVPYTRTSHEEEVNSELITSIEEIESSLVELVNKIIKPLFIVFDYFEVHESNIETIVNNFVKGKIL